MSYKIENTAIKLTRGDTFITTVAFQYKDGTPYVPSAGDTVRFALKSSRMLAGKSAFYDKDPLILKDIPVSTMELRLDPNDTKSLPFGLYKYDIELTRENGIVTTPIADEDFEITPEVY